MRWKSDHALAGRGTCALSSRNENWANPVRQGLGTSPSPAQSRPAPAAPSDDAGRSPTRRRGSRGSPRSRSPTRAAILGMMLLTEARRSQVAEMLQDSGVVTIADMQSRFGVSPMTARRDLAILAERGVARRTHGGAVLPSLAAPENSFAQRMRDAPDAKARLAEAAFAMLMPGETVFLDASSTTYFLARLIA